MIAMDQRWAVDPISLFSDSQGAIAMNYNPVNRAANRHINLADHYAREQLANGIITITYVKSKDQLADFLTKKFTSCGVPTPTGGYPELPALPACGFVRGGVLKHHQRRPTAAVFSFRDDRLRLNFLLN